MADVKTSEKNTNTLFASSGYQTPQGNTPNAPKKQERINAFGKDLTVYENNEGRQFVMVPDTKGYYHNVYLDDPLFQSKESAYQDVLLRAQDLEESLENQEQVHLKWYEHWMEKVSTAVKNFFTGKEARDENHTLFNETLKKAGCTYLELKAKNDYASIDLQQDADKYYGQECDAKRLMWRSESEERFYGLLAFDEQKWLQGIRNVKTTAEHLFGALFNWS